MIPLKLEMKKSFPDGVLKKHFLKGDEHPLGKQKEKDELRQAVADDLRINLKPEEQQCCEIRTHPKSCMNHGVEKVGEASLANGLGLDLDL